MKGNLSGVVLGHTITSTETILKLAGITDNGAGGVTWIHHVSFSGTRRPTPLPAEGQPVRVTCIAAQEVFTGRGGVKASRVIIHGLSVTTIQGETVRKGEATFLLNAENTFTFAGFLVKAPVHKERPGVSEGRLGVRDRHDRLHYFQLEAWQGFADVLAKRKAGTEMKVTAILRRDRSVKDGVQRAFDVMEVRHLQPTQLPTRVMANAAD
jgi:hypothetical protein